MTCDGLIDALDDYVDGVATTATRLAVDAHLETCATCPALVADVRAIRAAARTLEPIEPPARVWQALEARLPAPAPARVSLSERLSTLAGWGTLLQPAAAFAGLVLVLGSLAWIASRLTPDARPAETARAGAPAEFQLAEAEYTDAIASLEEATEAGRPRLDALTNATLRSSIDDIDTAIGDAREALEREPGDELSQASLLEALGSKVTLLQDTVALLGEMDEATEAQTP